MSTEISTTTSEMDDQDNKTVPGDGSSSASPSAEDISEVEMPVHFRLSRNIVVLSDPEGERAESIRALRAHLLAGHMAHGRRSLAICGAGANSGATFLAVNLAVAFAKAGIATLLIDADLQEAGVGDFLYPDRPMPGLQNISGNPDRLGAENLRSDVLPNLSVIYAGTEARNATELFASRQFKMLIDDCMRDYEITIVNTPSGHSAADVRRIAKSVRYALVVARRDQTLMSELRNLVDELDSDKVNLIGTFLSDF
jgi:protein-tyrosine kinase